MSVDVAAIRARLAAATPGPWRFGITTSDPRRVAEVLDGTGETVHDIHGDHAICREEGEPGANAVLIAHAPADLAALCDEVDALRDEVAAKDAENERLRGLLWKASSVIGALVEPQCGNDTGFALRAKAAAVLDDLRAALREEPSHA